jgi:D-alanine transfer protein
MHKHTFHLLAGLASLILIVGLLWGFSAYAATIESRYVHGLAPYITHQSNFGSALQRAAFHQPDLLPVYGSSEIASTAEFSSVDFFRLYPTGFAAFDIRFVGGSALNLAQTLAAVGPDLRGKKVVISFTPRAFMSLRPGPIYYPGNFSTLHAAGLIFNIQLSEDIKSQAARHMWQYPDTLTKDLLLKFAIQNLGVDQPLNRLAYYLALPLGQLDLLVLRLQDHWALLQYIQQNPTLVPDPLHKPSVIDWNARIAEARKIQTTNTSSNPYGVDNTVWEQGYKDLFAKKIPSGQYDNKYLGELQASEEWADLDILLHILKELGAQPLLLSQPFNGRQWDALGWSQASRSVYYKKLRQEAAKFGYPVVDLQGHESDPLFVVDTSSHPSRVGLVYTNQVLDAFYHGKDLAQFNR